MEPHTVSKERNLMAATKPVIEIVPESVSDEPIEKDNSRKREITAAIIAGAVTVLLGAASTGVINRIGDGVKNRIAPKPEKPEVQ